MDPIFNGDFKFLPIIGAKLIQEEAEKSSTLNDGKSTKTTEEAESEDTQQLPTTPSEEG